MKFIITEKNISTYIDNNLYTINNSDPYFNIIKRAIEENKSEKEVKKLFYELVSKKAKALLMKNGKEREE